VEIVFTLENIQELAAQLISKASGPKCLAFFAPMGAGKTTLINAICAQLGVLDSVSSPTYSIINEYETAKGEKIVHMDWYRLKDEDEVLNAGCVDYLEQGIYTFVEWPERAEHLLPTDCLRIHLSILDPQTRKCSIK